MPTYDQLDNETAWRAEIEPPALLELKAGIKRWRPAAGVGIKGDNRHLSGGHRSRRWIKTSSWCTNRTYTVSRTPGDRSGGNDNWCCAVDIWGVTQADLHAMCKRLDAAIRAGRLEKITEWYGNFGDDGRVDGYDNISNRLASSDSSHLTHVHMTFDRGRANEDHSDLLAILTGDDMSWSENLTAGADMGGRTFSAGAWLIGANWTGWEGLKNDAAILALLGTIAEKLGADPAELDALKAAAEEGAKAGVAASAQQLAAAIAAALSDELGLSEGEAEAAVERALRRVLGTLDNATPAVGS